MHAYFVQKYLLCFCIILFIPHWNTCSVACNSLQKQYSITWVLRTYVVYCTYSTFIRTYLYKSILCINVYVCTYIHMYAVCLYKGYLSMAMLTYTNGSTVHTVSIHGVCRSSSGTMLYIQYVHAYCIIVHIILRYHVIYTVCTCILYNCTHHPQVPCCIYSVYTHTVHTVRILAAERLCILKVQLKCSTLYVYIIWYASATVWRRWAMTLWEGL